MDTPKHNYPQLLSLAVHELRTPASVVGGYIRMLLRDAEPPLTERQRRMLEETEKSCARLVAIISEISEVGKLDSGQIQLTRQPLDLFALIAQVADLVHEGKDRDVRLEVRCAAESATVTGDATRLRQAFDAIFRAILREKAGRVTVVAECRVQQIEGRPSAVVVVAESGSVQAAYDREAGPFYDKRGGMGLALPLAGRVIEGLGGRIVSPAPAPEFAAMPDGRGVEDPLTRGSVIVFLPITELSR